MLSLSNLLCGQRAGNEALRYGHTRRGGAPDDGVPRPVVVWALTKACNLRCVHCYASATPGPAPGELSFAEGVALLDDLRDFGVPAVLFSGGEPLARPDALRLIDYAQFIGLNCTLSTNGLLIDERTADALAEMGLRYVGISLDGSPAKHDRLRGKKGAFGQSVAAIDRCRARGIKVGVRFTVSGLNLSDLDSVFDVCLEHGVERLCVYHLAYAGRGGNLQDVDLTARQTRAAVDRIIQRTREAAADFGEPGRAAGRGLEVLTVGNHADAGYLLLKLEAEAPHRREEAEALLRGTGGNRSGCDVASIDPVGGVHYDQFSWHYDCGNVRERAFSAIWSGATDGRLKVLRDRAARLPARCRGCRFVEVCNGNLRTRAEAATGDWLGQDPGCYLSDEEIAPVEASGV
jgi:radical SAM protein with 4Fe4S-binding SPASM domain